MVSLKWARLLNNGVDLPKNFLQMLTILEYNVSLFNSSSLCIDVEVWFLVSGLYLNLEIHVEDESNTFPPSSK